MNDPRKKLTPWLILLIVLIGPLQLSGANILRTIEHSFRPLFPHYPSLPNAIIIYQATMVASIAVWMITAWVIYRRESGTLFRVQTGYFAGAALRILGSYSIVLLGGLPAEMTSVMVKEQLPETVISLVVVGAWSSYLIRSTRVREIYA